MKKEDEDKKQGIIEEITTAEPEELVEYFDYLLNKAYEDEKTQDPEIVWADLYDRIFSIPICGSEYDEECDVVTYDVMIDTRWPQFKPEIDVDAQETDLEYWKKVVEMYISAFKSFAEYLKCPPDDNMFPRFDQWKKNKEIKW